MTKKLIESLVTDKEVSDLTTNPMWLTHPFVKKWNENYAKALKEAGEPELGAVRGQTIADANGAGAMSQVYATLEIFNAVIRGFTRYMDDSFVRKYVTDSVVFKVPKLEYRELVGNIDNGAGGTQGQLPHTEKMIDYATVDLSTPESEKGGKVTWTRALLEDITFDVQAEMAEGLGHAVAVAMMTSIVSTLQGIKVHSMPLANNTTITAGGWTWAEFLKLIGSVDTGVHLMKMGYIANATFTGDSPVGCKVIITTGESDSIDGTVVDYLFNSGTYNYTLYVALKGNASTTEISDIDEDDTLQIYNAAGTLHWTGPIEIASGQGGAITDLGFRTYGPADFCLVSPDIYWELLNIIQMTNVLYEGSTDPVKKGVIKLALGCTVVKQGLLPQRTAIALNSEKAVALVTRRTLKIEPVLFPAWNEYGFIGTVRYGTTIIYDSAIQIAKT